jgi:hypothetical protein
MKALLRSVALLGTSAVMIWGVKQIIEEERQHGHKSRKRQMQTWEGEGGNLAPHEQTAVMPRVQ